MKHTIVWFSNCDLSIECKGSGSWLYSMSDMLTNSGECSLFNFTIKNVSEIESIQIKTNFVQYLLPQKIFTERVIADKKALSEIRCVVDKIAPDIIHIWGIENYFSKIASMDFFSQPVLLEIQGLFAPCADVYYTNLTVKELFACLNLRDLLFPYKSIFFERHRLEKRGEEELSILSKYANISVQSDWVKRLVQLSSCADLFDSKMSIRKLFMNSAQWQYPQNNRKFIFVSSSAIPYKALHVAYKALACVKQKYNDVQLIVVGSIGMHKFPHKTGYYSFLEKLEKKLGIRDSIIKVGSKDAEGIIQIMYESVGLVQTSFVESYSLVVAEAQALGLPVVVPYAGAMPELANHLITSLNYSPGDYRSLASFMVELIENQSLAKIISTSSRRVSISRNDPITVLNNQLEIYKRIIGKIKSI